LIPFLVPRIRAKSPNRWGPDTFFPFFKAPKCLPPCFRVLSGPFFFFFFFFPLRNFAVFCFLPPPPPPRAPLQPSFPKREPPHFSPSCATPGRGFPSLFFFFFFAPVPGLPFPPFSHTNTTARPRTAPWGDRRFQPPRCARAPWERFFPFLPPAPKNHFICLSICTFYVGANRPCAWGYQPLSSRKVSGPLVPVSVLFGLPWLPTFRFCSARGGLFAFFPFSDFFFEKRGFLDSFGGPSFTRPPRMTVLPKSGVVKGVIRGVPSPPGYLPPSAPLPSYPLTLSLLAPRPHLPPQHTPPTKLSLAARDETL